ncbi:MAG: hypothetical protein NUV76_09780, partial [Candidatus Kuenenia sp.]|nr:hypothetical protein [Candidatus Kuenenia sp.]
MCESINKAVVTLWFFEKLCPPLAGVQGVDWISPLIQLPLYYENKFAPLSHAPQTGQMDNFILFRDMHFHAERRNEKKNLWL